MHKVEISLSVLSAVCDKLKASGSTSKAKLVGDMKLKIQNDNREGVYFKAAAKRYDIKQKRRFGRCCL
jgi:hypothetical protein